MMAKSDFTRFFTVYRHYAEDKKVKSIELTVSANDIRKGRLYLTDLQLQNGSQATGQIINTREMMKLERFTIDETKNAVNSLPNRYLGDEPRVYSDMKNRFFNIVGRGFETIVIPNVYHEDFTKELLTTGLDLTIYPKNDYDFLRVSTFYGGELEDNQKTYQDESLAENPLNSRYTREFCFEGGKVGDEIKLSTSGQFASVNGNRVPLGVQRFDVGQEETWEGTERVIYENRQRFMALPIGATRIKIEFMRLEKDGNLEYMVDGGIGFYGLAEFTQWTWGGSRL